jgi:hypothetical protein
VEEKILLRAFDLDESEALVGKTGNSSFSHVCRL